MISQGHFAHLFIHSSNDGHCNHNSTLCSLYYIIRSACWIMFVYKCHLNEDSVIFMGDTVENEISLVALDDRHVRT